MKLHSKLIGHTRAEVETGDMMSGHVKVAEKFELFEIKVKLTIVESVLS